METVEYYLKVVGQDTLKNFLTVNVWQAGEVERDVKILRKNGVKLSDLGLTVKAHCHFGYFGMSTNKVKYITYTYIRK